MSQNTMTDTKRALFVYQFNKVVGREPSADELAVGINLDPVPMMDMILDTLSAERLGTTGRSVDHA